mmetsp:Transcript_38073/g.80618  ORF Transcript_38073/g.80618 Transcript_38073/m.80618 type:complete len:212 (-) Transcript_38073:1295-1930(-)
MRTAAPPRRKSMPKPVAMPPLPARTPHLQHQQEALLPQQQPLLRLLPPLPPKLPPNLPRHWLRQRPWRSIVGPAWRLCPCLCSVANSVPFHREWAWRRPPRRRRPSPITRSLRVPLRQVLRPLPQHLPPQQHLPLPPWPWPLQQGGLPLPQWQVGTSQLEDRPHLQRARHPEVPSESNSPTIRTWLEASVARAGRLRPAARRAEKEGRRLQ